MGQRIAASTLGSRPRRGNSEPYSWPVTLVTVKGSGRERGRSHGEQLRAEIRDVLARVVEDLGGSEEVDRFIDGNDFESAIARHTPDLHEELLGIAEGAGAERRHVLVHNLMDEHWWWSQAVLRESCSTIAAPPMVGQTMDLDRVLDGSQVVVRNEAADGSASVVLTSAGMIGLCGASTAGFAICVNALTTLGHSSSGLPVAFVMRGALAQADTSAAVRFLESVPHASGQHFALVGRDASGSMSSASLECSAAGAVAAAAPGTRFGHANHPLATLDIDVRMVPSETSSLLRQEVLDASLDVTSLGQLTALLSAAPLCVPRTDRPWLTFGAIAVDVSEETTLRYALGPPDTTPWQQVAVT